MNVVCNSVVTILPVTFRSPVILASPPTLKSLSNVVFPVTSNVLSISVFTLTCNPKFGEITASAEPDFNLSISPIAPAEIFVI